MNIDTLYEWEVIVKGHYLGKTTTEKRHELIRQAVEDGTIEMPLAGDIQFNLVKKLLDHPPGPQTLNNLGT